MTDKTENNALRKIHSILPVYDAESKILILGSFPSVKFREQGFFYAHPQNRFWAVLSTIFGENQPVSVEDKKKFLLRNHIALWDVISSCDIIGSSDSSIKNVEPNDISALLGNSAVGRIFTNGKKKPILFIANTFSRRSVFRQYACRQQALQMRFSLLKSFAKYGGREIIV